MLLIIKYLWLSAQTTDTGLKITETGIISASDKSTKDADALVKMPVGAFAGFRVDAVAGGAPITAWKDTAYTITKFPFDTTKFNDRFLNDDHVFLQDTGTNNKWYFDNKRSLSGSQTPAKKRLGIKISPKNYLIKLLVVPVKNVKKDSTYKVRFSLEQKPYDNNKYRFFPELKAFDNKVFYTTEETKNSVFKKKYLSKKAYYDIRIEYTKGNDYCLIHLKHKEGVTTIEANITDGKENIAGNYKLSGFNYRYKRYLKLLAKREKEFNTQLKWKKIRYKQLIKTLSDGVSAAIVQPNNQYYSMAWGMNIKNVFQLRYYGSISKPYTTITNVKIKTDTDSVFTPQLIYAVDFEMNTITAFTPKLVKFSKKKTIVLLTIDSWGNVFYANKNSGIKIKGKTLLMQRVDRRNLTSTARFIELLGL